MYKSIFEKHSGNFEFLEFCLVESKKKTFSLKDGLEDGVKSGESSDIYVRIIEKGKTFSFKSGGTDPDTLDEALSSAKSKVFLMPEDEFITKPQWGSELTYMNEALNLYDEKTASAEFDVLNEYARYAYHSAKEQNQLVRAVKQVEVSCGSVKTVMMNSLSPAIEKLNSWGSAMVYSIAEKNGDQEEGYSFESKTSISNIDFDYVGKTSAENASGLLGAKKLPTGKYTIVFDREVAADFVELIFELVEAENVYKQKTFLQNKLGKKVASKILNITDEPFINKSLGSCAFDDEGVKTKYTEIIKNGELNSFLHNSYTAKLLGMENTANAARDGGGKIGISYTNLVLKPSHADVNLSSVPKLVKIKEVMGMHTADPISGDFSVGVTGVFFDGGKEGSAFKEAVLTGNLRDLLDSCEHVFDNTKSFGGVITGDILFGEFTISGS